MLVFKSVFVSLQSTLRLGVVFACAISAQTCAGMDMFPASLTAWGSLQSFVLFTCMMVIFSLIPESFYQSVFTWFFLISFQFRLHLTCYEIFYQIISMWVLSLEGCLLCGSHMRALPRLSLILRMFSPPLPSLLFQACKNCSQLVWVCTEPYRMYGMLKIQFSQWNSMLRCFLVKLSYFPVFSHGKNAVP